MTRGRKSWPHLFNLIFLFRFLLWQKKSFIWCFCILWSISSCEKLWLNAFNTNEISFLHWLSIFYQVKKRHILLDAMSYYSFYKKFRYHFRKPHVNNSIFFDLCNLTLNEKRICCFLLPFPFVVFRLFVLTNCRQK